MLGANVGIRNRNLFPIKNERDVPETRAPDGEVLLFPDDLPVGDQLLGAMIADHSKLRRIAIFLES